MRVFVLVGWGGSRATVSVITIGPSVENRWTKGIEDENELSDEKIKV